MACVLMQTVHKRNGGLMITLSNGVSLASLFHEQRVDDATQDIFRALMPSKPILF